MSVNLHILANNNFAPDIFFNSKKVSKSSFQNNSVVCNSYPLFKTSDFINKQGYDLFPKR